MSVNSHRSCLSCLSCIAINVQHGHAVAATAAEVNARVEQARAKGGYEGDLDMDAELQRLDRRQNAALAVRGDRMGPGASQMIHLAFKAC